MSRLASATRPSCASLLKALADDSRLAIVRQLLDGPKHVGEINSSLGLKQTLMSHHLRVLREAGLVNSRRDGQRVLYSLAPEFQDPSKREAINLGCCLLSFD